MTRLRTHVVLLLLLACMAAPAAAQERIKWAPSLQAAINMASRQNQLVLLHFWAPGCAPCKALDKNVFSRQDVADFVDQHYVPVKINAAVMPDTAKRYKVDRWPMDVIITPAGYAVHTMVSPQDPREYMNILNKVAVQRNPSGGGAVAALGAAEGIRNVASQAQNQFSNSAGAAQDRFNQASQQTADRFSQVADQTRNRFDNVSGEVQQGAQDWRDAASGAAAAWGGADRFANAGGAPPANAGGDRFASNGNSPEARFASNPQGGGAQANPYLDQPQPNTGSPVQGNPYMNQPPAPRNPAPNNPGPQANATPVGNPPLGLDGHCPVTLLTQTKWTKGDARYGIIHRGRTYLFVSEDAKKQFWEDPDRYAPILSGNDPVEFADSGRLVKGQRAHGVFFRSQIYLFSSEDTLRRFWDAPQRYSDVAREAMDRSRDRAQQRR